jgi:HSP20 family protein
MLVQFDPYREADRVAAALLGAPLPATRVAMDAVQRADHVELRCDLPGVDADSIDVAVDGDVLTVRAERHLRGCDGDHPLELECTQGVMTRDVRLSDSLDPSRHDFEYRDGVLAVRIPLAAPPVVRDRPTGRVDEVAP